jgi:hypothetical protein
VPGCWLYPCGRSGFILKNAGFFILKFYKKCSKSSITILKSRRTAKRASFDSSSCLSSVKYLERIAEFIEGKSFNIRDCFNSAVILRRDSTE